MNKNSTKRRTQMIAIGLASVALLAVVAFGAIQALTTTDAENIALDQYPGATVLQTELDDENGASVYSVELQAASGKVEVKIDPNSGAVLAADPDDDHEDADENDDAAEINDLDDDQIENEQDGDFENED
jgi:uncharacterized membrane protein YkoI